MAGKLAFGQARWQRALQAALTRFQRLGDTTRTRHKRVNIGRFIGRHI
jgi:hypothetical protein